MNKIFFLMPNLLLFPPDNQNSSLQRPWGGGLFSKTYTPAADIMRLVRGGRQGSSKHIGLQFLTHP